MARLGDYIREERVPLGSEPTELRLIGVSNAQGLHASSRKPSADLSRYQRIKRGWFAYNPMRVNVGSIGVADDDTKTGFTSPDYTVFSCRDGLEPQYLLHFLRSEQGLEAIAQKCTGTVRKRLYFSGLAEIELSVPGVHEQLRLVKQISRVAELVHRIKDESVRRHELPQLRDVIRREAVRGALTQGWRTSHESEESAAALFRRLKVQKSEALTAQGRRKEKALAPVRAEDLPRYLPPDWVACRYGELCEYVTSGSRGWQKYYSESGALFLRAQNIKTDELRLDDRVFVELPEKIEGKRAHVQEGDVLITITGGNLGRTAIVPVGLGEAYVSQHIALTRPADPAISRWIHLVLTTDEGPRGELLGVARGDKPGLNLPNIRNVVIPLPPVTEQLEILTRVDAFLERCRVLSAEVGDVEDEASDLVRAVLRDAFRREH